MGIGFGLPAGGTLMFGWKKFAEAEFDTLEEDCVEIDWFWWEADCWDWLLWEEFCCCKALNLGEQVAVWVELDWIRQIVWVPASLVATSLSEGPFFRSSPNRFTILNGLSNLDTKYDLPGYKIHRDVKYDFLPELLSFSQNCFSELSDSINNILRKENILTSWRPLKQTWNSLRTSLRLLPPTLDALRSWTGGRLESSARWRHSSTWKYF